MTVEELTGREALDTAKRNKAFRDWPVNRKLKNRLEPFAAPNFTPSFHLIAGETVFTIGSCFARGIEDGLKAVGFDIAAHRIFDDPRISSSGVDASVLNKYTPQSILNEFRWALEPDMHPYPDPGAFFELLPDRWQDGNMHAFDECPLSIVRDRRKSVLEIARLVKECRVVIITPGIIEVWWDKETQSYLNQAPPMRYFVRNPDRFLFRVLDYIDVLEAFEEIHALLSKHLRPDFRILFSVSPVPLETTFRSIDVLVANTYSKSVLRTAAEVFCQRHSNVDYFPSYESVILSNRRLAFFDDMFHPTPEMIRANIQRMIEAYVPGCPRFEHPSDWDEDIEANSYRLFLNAQDRISELESTVKRLDAERTAQECVIEVTKKQLERSQQTTAQYLRQVLERDGVLDAS